MLAVEAVLVELRRRAVARRHYRHPGLDQRGEQPRQDHRVGRVGHHHLVERETARFVGERFGDRLDRVAGFLLALLGDALVHLEHELAEMDAALAADGQALEEQVHQHRLAAPDIAPQVDAARAIGPLAERAPQDRPAFGDGFEFVLQPVEPRGGGGLVGIGAKFARRDQRVVSGEDRGHRSDGGGLDLRSVPVKLAIVGVFSWTISPRRNSIRLVSRSNSIRASSGSPIIPPPMNCADRSSVTAPPAWRQPNARLRGEQRHVHEPEQRPAMDVVAHVRMVVTRHHPDARDVAFEPDLERFEERIEPRGVAKLPSVFHPGASGSSS